MLYIKKAVLLASIICIYASANAQIKEWMPGAVVMIAENDTIEGYIKDSDVVDRGIRVHFKRKKNQHR